MRITKIAIRRLLVEPIPNYSSSYPKDDMADNKEIAKRSWE